MYHICESWLILGNVGLIQLNIYLTPIHGIYSEGISALAYMYMLLNASKNAKVTSVDKTMQSELKELQVVGPRISVERSHEEQ